MSFQTSVGRICDRNDQTLLGTRKHIPYLEDHPRTCKWLESPPCISHECVAFWKGSGPTRSLGDLGSPWSLTTYIQRDDPPSTYRHQG